MHTMIRNANVQVTSQLTDRGDTVAHITVNDQFEHVFPASSRVSEQLSLITPEELGIRLSGGAFFFIGDKLIDFRDQRYHGFTHDDASINALMDVIGYHPIETRAARIAHRTMNRTSSSEIALSKTWSNTEIEIPMYKEGGQFSSRLNFTWNPFGKNIKSVFLMERLLCSNGMVGTTPFVNMSIPLVNRWQEHLEIANSQLQNKINNVMNRRLVEMSTSRATVNDLMVLHRHIIGRMGELDFEGSSNDGLIRMAGLIDPYENLSSYYKEDVFDNKAIASQLPAHLSLLDVWNMTTEVCTHYDPTRDSSDAGMQKLANEMVFDRACATDKVHAIGANIQLAPFSNAEQAFFGKVIEMAV